MEARDVVVVGSGLAGLIAAGRLRAEGYVPVVLDRSAAPGGRLRTRRLDGARMELGGAALTRASAGLCALVAELGLAGELVEPEARLRAAVLRDGTWHFLDHSTVRGLLGFSAISVRDRLLLLTDAARAVLGGSEADPGDVLTRARLDSRSIVDAISRSAAVFYAEGLTGLFWGIEAHEVSYPLLTMQPRVLRGRPIELRSGTAAMIDELARPLDVRCGVTVTRVEEIEDGVRVDALGPYGPVAFLSRSVILATDARTAGGLWAGAPPATGDFLSSVRYSRVDFAYFRTREPIGPRTPEGAPLAVATIPGTERGSRMLAGIRYVDHWAPTGGLVYVQAAARAGAEQLSDSALGDRLEAELLELSPELAGQITARHVGRHDRFAPVFDPGHLARLAGFRARPGEGAIELAGDYLRAPWLEGALRSAMVAATRTLRRLAVIPSVVDEVRR